MTVAPRRLLGLGPLSLALLLPLAWLAWEALQWGLLQAVFRPDLAACEAVRSSATSGACWGVVSAKWPLLLWGPYPATATWRPALATLLMLTAFGAGGWALRAGRLSGLQAALGFAATVGASLALVGGLPGGALGLAPVPSRQWGGLALTLLLSALTMATSLPLGLLLALGRRSRQPLLQAACTVFIEVVRGVPLVALLFMSAYLLPLLLPREWELPLFWRVWLAGTLFCAAYLSEIWRAGLQAIAQDELEAAALLGATRGQVLARIVVPQAWRTALPAFVNSFVGIIKDTSLVTVVGLFEISGALSLALGGDAAWRPFYLEAYLAVGAVYWVLCAGLSRLAQRPA